MNFTEEILAQNIGKNKVSGGIWAVELWITSPTIQPTKHLLQNFMYSKEVNIRLNFLIFTTSDITSNVKHFFQHYENCN